MKTQDAKDTANGTMIPGVKRRGNTSWLAGLGATLVVALLIGVSVFVFSQARQHATNGTVQTPPSGNWTQVLQGYTLNSLVAAPSNPAVLYACSLPGQSSSSTQGSSGSGQHFTVLHSSDFGAHWQAVGGNIALGFACQIAINPTNSNDVYAAGTSSGNAPSGILLHSTDGGQTWTTIKPTLSIPGPAHAPAWSVQQITVEGGHLYGIQFVQSGGPVPMQPSGMLLPRLVTSVDDGQTWTVLDTQIASTIMGVRDYAIDPSNTSTIYELLGPAFGPIQPAAGLPKSGLLNGIDDALYKSTDDGSTWKLVLANLPFGSQLQIARNAPNILYVGGIRTPLPYALQQNHPTAEPAFPLQNGAFHLHLSNDGGATWHDVPDLPQSLYALSWFASADGKIYTYSTNNLPGGSSNNLTPTIERFDPNSNAWSTLTRPPVSGLLLAVTPTDSSSGTALWLFANSSGKPALYRYIA